MLWWWYSNIGKCNYLPLNHQQQRRPEFQQQCCPDFKQCVSIQNFSYGIDYSIYALKCHGCHQITATIRRPKSSSWLQNSAMSNPNIQQKIVRRLFATQTLSLLLRQYNISPGSSLWSAGIQQYPFGRSDAPPQMNQFAAELRQLSK